MHRRAGSQRETVQARLAVRSSMIWICANGVRSKRQGVVHKPILGWQSTLEQRDLSDKARHFTERVQNRQFRKPPANRLQLAQRIVDKIQRDAMSE